MWINKGIKPLKEGYYKTLVDWNGLGNLKEEQNELFNGTDWDVYESNSQFIQYWWAEKEDYDTITEYLEKELDNYNKQLEKESKNFGGL